MTLRTALMALTVLLFVAGMTVFGVRVLAIGRVLRRARPAVRTDRAGARLASLAGQVLLHRRLLRVPLSGVLHFLIFSGFVVLFIDIVETVGEVFVRGFSVGPVLAPLVDVWVLLVLTGIVLALYNRLVLRPARFEGSDERDAFLILGLIATIVVGIVVHDSFYPFVAHEVYHIPDPTARSHFLGWALAGLWRQLGWTGPAAASAGYVVGYLMDMGTVLAFLAYLPYSKHFHIFLAVPNVYLRNLGPRGTLVPVPPQDTMAVRRFEDFTWKDILDLYTCTECGRCQAVCPAHAAGQPLSPKMLILNLRDALNARLEAGATAEAPPLAGGVISRETLWSCTTCGACQEACPVFIEHVPKIAGLRAALLEDGEVEPGAQKVLVAWERQGNSFAQPARKRAQWVKELDFPVKDARKEPVDWLWFVGDFASYDPRVQQLTRLVARLLHAAGVDFGILYEGEVNAGNEALRLGEYGLFETLAQKNLKALEQAQFNRLFTTDPHSLNALRNEYRKLGFERPVLHYTELFVELLDQGRLHLDPLRVRATYHDPCYLGRWNRVFEAPRELIRRCGVELVEMPRHGAQSFCCGAGGGRIWMDESGVQDRPANQRIREALALPGVNHFVVACPKDVSMFSASVTALGVEDRLRVVDVAELLAAAAGLALMEEGSLALS
ncbi:putative iron-sulfur-binding oxidoreductase FadF [Candidatus Hydrogenisulfobacillus filiaventi]|uniref:Putative iron-sulfur-binding oxidoreductase FadF n=1 Tax=Candidatus Hydrogenisulfobacillus filiaventi TaxID=2707344 RepID=A0A6F8ZFH5_9FIRM|nr:(Fe-S)-binding protein [Bacillota bacterium]CAB1128684.1 putative iron-sulfur-binding oxidoreductase FadF [Candidatus Hydrogenisulfobacillus filiaventi]